MGFFKKDYSKPGPGVPKNAPRKKGAARFFEILGRDFGNLVKLNLLYQLCLLPAQFLFFLSFIGLNPEFGGTLFWGLLALLASAFLVGPATTSVYYIVSKMMRDEPGFIWHDFWQRFKMNYKNSIIPGLFYGLIIGSAFYAYSIFFVLGGGSWLLIAIYIFAFLIMEMAIPYFFVQNAYLDLKMGGIGKNSLLLAVGKFPRSFMGFLLRVGIMVLQLSFIHISFIFVIFIGYTVPILLSLMWVWPPIDKTFKIEETLANRKDTEVAEGLAESGWVDENHEAKEQSKF